MRVAGIDCGTNSVRLLIAEVGPNETLVELVREMRIVRLGQDVDRTGLLAPEALERTRVALCEYANLMAEYKVDDARMIATSATRDAANSDEFIAMVRSTVQIEPAVIEGVVEAAMTFAGAVGGMRRTRQPMLVADIGGGSTELVLGDVGGIAGDLQAVSLDIGSVRLTERHLHSDPPTVSQISAARRDVVTAISAARDTVSLERAASFVGVAGTVTTMAAITLGLDRYVSGWIHESAMTAAQVHELADRLLTMTHDERAAIPVLHPGRVDVIAAGALILSELVTATGTAEVIASEHDILDAVTASVTVW